MSTNTKIYLYKNNPVSFLAGGENIKINATEMAKIFGRQVESFMRNENTEAFIREALKNENSRFLGIATRDDLYTSRQKSGTYMHRVLALKFAAWLSPSFELWVYSVIDEILFGEHRKRNKSFERTLLLQKEAEDLQNKPVKTGDDFVRYLEVQQELKREILLRKSITTENLSQMKLLFE